jgi:hypothetical protein
MSNKKEEPSVFRVLAEMINSIIVLIIWVYLLWVILGGVTINGVKYHVGACSPVRGVPLYRDAP